MKNTLSLIIALAISCFSKDLCAQSNSSSNKNMPELPYYQIPDAPETYTGENVLARMVDGLGFRYYWATEGLRDEDLSYKTSEEARTTNETLDHIYSLTSVILNAALNEPNIRPAPELTLSFEEKRRKTLENIKRASDILKGASDDTLKDLNMTFQSDQSSTLFPVWNLINGPVSDAIWHVGQVVAFRRASGNPFNSNVSVLRGKLRE